MSRQQQFKQGIKGQQKNNDMSGEATNKQQVTSRRQRLKGMAMSRLRFLDYDEAFRNTVKGAYSIAKKENDSYISDDFMQFVIEIIRFLGSLTDDEKAKKFYRHFQLFYDKLIENNKLKHAKFIRELYLEKRNLYNLQNDDSIMKKFQQQKQKQQKQKQVKAYSVYDQQVSKVGRTSSVKNINIPQASRGSKKISQMPNKSMFSTFSKLFKVK